MLKVLRFLNSFTKSRLTNIQRCQALFTMTVMSCSLFFPQMAFAQLNQGAGQNNNQCNDTIWFFRNLFSLIASTFGGLGGSDSVVCRSLNMTMILSLVIVIAMIGWGTVDHHGHGTPLKKAFEPFMGWLLGIFVIWAVIGVFSFGVGVGGNAAGPGIQNP